MSFKDTLIAVALTGVLTIAGVLLGAWQAARTAAEGDKRRDAALEAADARRDAAEHQRWIREKRLAAYTAFLAETDAWPDDASANGSTDAFLAVAKKVSAASGHVKLMASPDVDQAASAYFNRQMELTRVCAQSPPADRAALIASTTALRDAYVALLGAMRREVGVESSDSGVA